MKPIGSLPKIALLAGVALGSSLLSGAFQASAEVGVAAAVNVDAKGRPPGAAPRVITLGSNVVFNEEITTDGQGLVQILLLDGTTFTVGPNSQLTIDEFVYNPDTGDAKVVASLTKGVFRFVGARTSQTEGGATVKTPVGTIGIRGAVANISYEGNETKAALVAGNKLTITDGGGTQRIVYETGFTAVISKSPDGGTTTTIRKSTKEEAGLIQQQLSSKPGQNGGAGSQPDDEQTEEVARNNSELPDMMWLPPLKPVQSSGPELEEETIDGKTQDDLNDDIANQQSTTTVVGFFSGIGQSDVDGEGSYALTSAPIYCEGQDCEGESNFTVRVNAAGDPISGEGLLEDSQQGEYYSETGQNPVVSKLLVRFGGGQTELFDEEGDSHTGQSENIIVSGRTTAVDNVVYQHCTECDFIEWGWWGTEVATAASEGIPQSRVDKVVNGTWVAGDITSADAIDPDVVLNEGALPFGGSAQYNGTAIGTVSREGDPTYIATGDFNMTYNFAGRSGEASINNFDGNYDVSGYVFDYSNDTQALFAGQIEGYSYTDGYVSGNIQGAFVNDGPNVAAGAIGNFAFSNSGVNVVGTVAGVGSAYNP